VEILIVKTAALGDVLRTTSILPGLRRRYPLARVTWLTGRGAEDLVRFHPEVAEVLGVVSGDPDDLWRVRERLAARRFARILSLDEELGLARLATELARGERGVLTGACARSDGSVAYTPDAAPWFDLGLLSVYGRAEADRRKRANRASHAELLARVAGVEPGEPALPLPETARAFAAEFAQRTRLFDVRPVIGMNTGAGGRWESKKLPLSRALALMEELARRGGGRRTFLLLGGPDERERNAEIVRRAAGRVRLVDAGVANAPLDFAALVDGLDLLVTSDSLALHVAIARHVPVVAFFAPTSAAEIDLHGRGEKVASLAADAGSYRSEADTSTLTVERLAAACERVLARGREGRASGSAGT
jgi:heptosyltransferase-2